MLRKYLKIVSFNLNLKELTLKSEQKNILNKVFKFNFSSKQRNVKENFNINNTLNDNNSSKKENNQEQQNIKTKDSLLFQLILFSPLYIGTAIVSSYFYLNVANNNFFLSESAVINVNRLTFNSIFLSIALNSGLNIGKYLNYNNNNLDLLTVSNEKKIIFDIYKIISPCILSFISAQSLLSLSSTISISVLALSYSSLILSFLTNYYFSTKYSHLNNSNNKNKLNYLLISFLLNVVSLTLLFYFNYKQQFRKISRNLDSARIENYKTPRQLEEDDVNIIGQENDEIYSQLNYEQIKQLENIFDD